MDLALLKCPHCGAPVEVLSSAPGIRTCAFCRHVSLLSLQGFGGPLLLDDGPARHAGKPRLELDGVRWVVLGRLARGESSDVFLGCTDQRLSEQVVIKLLRAETDADLIENEWRAVQSLAGSEVQGSSYFSTLVPQPVAHGMARTSEPTRRLASVFRFRPGFVHTLDDVRRAHPEGVSPAAGVWLWKRLLEVLGWAHRAGYLHGALVPRHVLVQPRDHGVALVGWSCAVRVGRDARLIARVDGARVFYPPSATPGAPVDTSLDLAMAARCVIETLGGDPARGEPPRSTPTLLRDLLRASAQMDFHPGGDAWSLEREVSSAARAALGPPRFQPLSMPGWR